VDNKLRNQTLRCSIISTRGSHRLTDIDNGSYCGLCVCRRVNNVDRGRYDCCLWSLLLLFTVFVNYCRSRKCEGKCAFISATFSCVVQRPYSILDRKNVFFFIAVCQYTTGWFFYLTTLPIILTTIIVECCLIKESPYISIHIVLCVYECTTSGVLTGGGDNPPQISGLSTPMCTTRQIAWDCFSLARVSRFIDIYTDLTLHWYDRT